MFGRSLIDLLSAVPVPALSLVIIFGALVFDVGFFLAIGFHFINLFSLQEHLVFGLTGSAILITLTGIAAQLNTNLVDYYKDNGDILKYYFAVAVYVASFVLVAGVFGINTYEDVSPITAAWAGLGFVFAATLIFVLHAATFPAFIALFAILETFSFGTYYGNFLMFSQEQHKVTWAKSSAGEKFGVLRVGSEYSLLTSSTNVVSVARTTDIYLSSDQKN